MKSTHLPLVICPYRVISYFMRKLVRLNPGPFEGLLNFIVGPNSLDHPSSWLRAAFFSILFGCLIAVLIKLTGQEGRVLAGVACSFAGLVCAARIESFVRGRG